MKPTVVCLFITCRLSQKRGRAGAAARPSRVAGVVAYLSNQTLSRNGHHFGREDEVLHVVLGQHEWHPRRLPAPTSTRPGGTLDLAIQRLALVLVEVVAASSRHLTKSADSKYRRPALALGVPGHRALQHGAWVAVVAPVGVHHDVPVALTPLQVVGGRLDVRDLDFDADLGERRPGRSAPGRACPTASAWSRGCWSRSRWRSRLRRAAPWPCRR